MTDSAQEFMTTAQVNGMTGIPQATLRYYRHCGTGPASFRMGKRVVYRRSEVLKWIEAQEVATGRGGAA